MLWSYNSDVIQTLCHGYVILILTLSFASNPNQIFNNSLFCSSYKAITYFTIL